MSARAYAKRGAFDSEIACLEVESESVEDEKESEWDVESNGEDAIRCRSPLLPIPAHVVLPHSVRGCAQRDPGDTVGHREKGRAGRDAQ